MAELLPPIPHLTKILPSWLSQGSLGSVELFPIESFWDWHSIDLCILTGSLADFSLASNFWTISEKRWRGAGSIEGQGPWVPGVSPPAPPTSPRRTRSASTLSTCRVTRGSRATPVWRETSGGVGSSASFATTMTCAGIVVASGWMRPLLNGWQLGQLFLNGLVSATRMVVVFNMVFAVVVGNRERQHHGTRRRTQCNAYWPGLLLLLKFSSIFPNKTSKLFVLTGLTATFILEAKPHWQQARLSTPSPAHSAARWALQRPHCRWVDKHFLAKHHRLMCLLELKSILEHEFSA